jgi:hypothetical protein
MIKLYDLAKIYTAAAGTTSPLALGAAVSGFLTFALAGVQDGEIIRYGIRDGANSEVGWGVVGGSGSTLTRNVTSSTNDGSPIVLSGAATVFIFASKDDIQTRVIKSADYTALPGQVVMGFAGLAPWTLSLPAFPSTGDIVELFVDLGASPAHSIAVSGNGKNIYSPFNAPAQSSVRIGLDGQRVVFRYDGAAWKAMDQWGDLYIAPKLADFTWLNQNGASASDTSAGLTMSSPDQGQPSCNTLIKSAPAFSSVTAFVTAAGAPGNYSNQPLMVRNSSNGRFFIISKQGELFFVGYSDNLNGGFSWPFVNYGMTGDPVWFRWRVSGGNLVLDLSSEGVVWCPTYSVALASWIGGVDQVGLYVDAGAGNNSGSPLLINCKSFIVT